MTPERAAVEAAWLSLLSLPGVGPGRLWDIAVDGDPIGTWKAMSTGAPPAALSSTAEQRAAWRSGAAAIDPESLVEAHAASGITVTLHGDRGHPSIDQRDPHVPPVLLWRGGGSPAELTGRPSVGIIGTRRATRAGVELAREFGRSLALAGCTVVSGLALGVDAAGHRGALEAGAAPPLGVVGSGLDVVYPRANRALWHDVAERGLLCSEYPLTTPPAAWRFPARNRILVALCDVVVVVESHERGGSLITAGIAGARGVPVLAVPGAVRSPASVGTNRLIADGCQPCLGAEDVLAALGLTTAPTLPFPDRDGSAVPDDRASPAEAEVLDALGWVARSVDELADDCPTLGLADLSLAVASLLGRRIVVERDGRLERAR